MKRTRSQKYSATITNVANSVAFQDHFMKSFATWAEQPIVQTWEALGIGNSKHHPRRRTPVSLGGSCCYSASSFTSRYKIQTTASYSAFYPTAATSSCRCTAAQHYGLVEGPKPKLAPLEWTKVKELSRQRMDSLNPCPICKKKFQIKEKVILSCSHVFHRACVVSFEKYSQLQPCCPVCRTTHYEKLVLKNTSTKFRHLCATRYFKYAPPEKSR